MLTPFHPFTRYRMDPIRRLWWRWGKLNFALLLSIYLDAPSASADTLSGIVVDAETNSFIRGAIVTLDKQVTITDDQGYYAFNNLGRVLRIRATGFRRFEANALNVVNPAIIKLTPFTVKGLYLSVYGIGTDAIRQPALAVAETAGLNSVIVDLKGDTGLIPYPSHIPLAAAAGSLKVRTIGDLASLVSSMKKRGFYMIARIVVFKDSFLARARPAWAVHNRDGSLWKDPAGVSWIDPFQTEAWNYSIDIAQEAAESGFDEIQFDYARFPDALGLVYAQPASPANRIGTIVKFLETARHHLENYNVFLSIDVFGYVCWNQNDTQIGQRLEELSDTVDYISPMLYPSSFQFGIPGYRDPVADPYAIVYNSLARARHRTIFSRVQYRPWLQAFRDYAFDRRKFGDAEIRAQTKAAQDAGALGWMLWNPRNVYSTDGLLNNGASNF